MVSAGMIACSSRGTEARRSVRSQWFPMFRARVSNASYCFPYKAWPALRSEIFWRNFRMAWSQKPLDLKTSRGLSDEFGSGKVAAIFKLHFDLDRLRKSRFLSQQVSVGRSRIRRYIFSRLAPLLQRVLPQSVEPKPRIQIRFGTAANSLAHG